MESYSFRVTEEAQDTRLDVFVSRMLPQISRTQVQRLIEDNNILVGGKTAKPNYRLTVGESILCQVPRPQRLTVAAEQIALDIVYEDVDLLVVNKPQGMVVHPAHGHISGTLVNALLHHCDDLSGINGILRPGIVHRIDKDTSGLLVITKNDFAHQSLAQQIKEHAIKRVYLALVHGAIVEPSGLIEAPIGRDLHDRQRMAVVLKNSKNAITEYRVLERLKDYTLVECRLKTGRTHQIRVHMAYLKHPVVGDAKYGPKKAHLGLNGQALHAAVLGFSHPRTAEWLEFSAPPPASFLNVLKKLGSSYLADRNPSKDIMEGAEIVD
jgi:23S rRNA pseudouridine1911/1915/1917 synthase